jgi:hypothetical protein
MYKQLTYDYWLKYLFYKFETFILFLLPAFLPELKSNVSNCLQLAH